MENTHTLTAQEKSKLKTVLSHDNDAVMLMHGTGEDRQISFYAAETRLEARLEYPETPVETDG